MSKVRVAAFSISLDGFGAGPAQDLNNPLGIRGSELHGWFRDTDIFKKMLGQGEGSRGIDNNLAAQSFNNIGAWILGRNMFGPVRGAWEGDTWKGWWGPNPPYHTPVFVLTHHDRPPLQMEGGTTFHFITEGADSALKQAKHAANGKDVRIGGGVSTIRQYCSPARLMSCTWPSRLSCWAKANTCLRESISTNSALLRSGPSTAKTRLTS